MTILTNILKIINCISLEIYHEYITELPTFESAEDSLNETFARNLLGTRGEKEEGLQLLAKAS